jgi:SPP1 family predicted phage head-tail adaptor
MKPCDDEIAELRHRVTLEAPVRTPDEGGTAVITWSAVADVWAAVRSVGGRERVEADRLAGRITHEIRIRWRDGVDATQRFRLGARLFLIHAARDPDARRRVLLCTCEEVGP